ncbi:MAG: hypothetical protein HY822_20835 [Acidobacteria bacterium]|nr:hypothetical protein [Acidobacteriota bacterium]
MQPATPIPATCQAPTPPEAYFELLREGVVRQTRRALLTPSAPGVFTLSGDGRGAGVVMHASDFRFVTPENPAAPGEMPAVYATGPGSVWPEVPAGEDTSLALGMAGVHPVNFAFDPSSGPGAKDLSVAGSNVVTVFSR